MRWRLASFLVVSVLCLAGVSTAQSKAQHYHARLVVDATSEETYELNHDQGKEHAHWKGKAHFEMKYSQNFAVVIQNGVVSLSHTEGPVSSSVTGIVSTNAENWDDPDAHQIATENFGSSWKSGDTSDEGTGSGSAIVIQDFHTNGSGLAIRVAMDGQLKGTCKASFVPVPACLDDAFTYMSLKPGEKTSPPG